MIQCSLSKAEFIRYSKVKSNNVRMVMLRFDEMNDSTLMIHVIDPYAQRSELVDFRNGFIHSFFQTIWKDQHAINKEHFVI